MVFDLLLVEGFVFRDVDDGQVGLFIGAVFLSGSLIFWSSYATNHCKVVHIFIYCVEILLEIKVIFIIY